MSKGIETKDKILTCALQLVRLNGLDSLTIGDVAKSSAMSKSGVFTHFESRDELLLKVIDFSIHEFKRKVFDRSLLVKAGLPRIYALSDLWLQWDDDASGGCPFLSAAFEFDDRPGPIRNAVANTQEKALKIWEKAAELAIQEKDFKINSDCAQFAYEVFGNIMIYNMVKRLLKSTKAISRYREGFESIINKYKVNPKK
ncbi:MAG: helix-turn-helix domain-containing protein [Pseudobdellovibrio sp.]